MHFFTEPNVLSVANNSQRFGPVLFGPYPSSTDPTDLYYTYDNKVFNVTTVFGLTASAKIFACQDCMMIVQRYVDVTTGVINNDLVNIILKPSKGLDIAHTPVKYYVYRGVLKSSFISGTDIVPPTTPNPTSFITRFWQGWNKQKIALGLPASAKPTPQSFGFDSGVSSLPENTPVEEIFNSAQSTNTAINDFQAINVKEGEWIGNFGANNIGFEIVTDTDNIKPDLGYVRTSNYIIDVTALFNVTPVTSESKFNLKVKREEVLNYIDPVAFFGMHYEKGMKVKIGSAAPVVKKGADLYNIVVSKFFNKDCFYLDLRSEKGFSYNFYDNYGDTNGVNIQLTKSTSSIAVTSQFDYGEDRFPIIIFRAAAEFANPDFVKTTLDIRLRIDDNEQPLLFLENPKLLGTKNTNAFKDEKTLKDAANPGWTKEREIELLLPVVTVGTQKVNIASVARLQYFRQAENPASPNTIFKNSSLMDTVFGGLEIPAIVVPTSFNHIRNTKRGFVKGSDFSYVSETGAYIDPDKVVLYANSAFPLKISKRTYPKIDFSVFKFNTLGSKSPVLPKSILYNRWNVEEAGPVSVKIIDIVGYNLDKRATNVENIFFLGLTRTEFDMLKNISGLSTSHQRYLVFEEVANQQDITTGTPYRKYKLKIQGLNASGVVTPGSPATDIFVYGSAANMLCSKNFADSANLPNLLPDPGEFNEFEYVYKFDYKATDTLVTGLFSNGEVQIFDKGGNQGIVDPLAELNGFMIYPVKTSGSSVISNTKTSYPVIVVIHGNGQLHTEYEEICRFFAHNGFVAASINCLIAKKQFALTGITVFPHGGIDYDYYFNWDATFLYSSVSKKLSTYKKDPVTFVVTVTPTSLIEGIGKDFEIIKDAITSLPKEIKFKKNRNDHGMGALGRSNLLYPHLQIIKKKLLTKVNNNIGIMGHSRGGEGVVRNAKELYGDSTVTPTIPAKVKRFTDFATRPVPKWQCVPNDLDTVKAIISLAPADQADEENLHQNIPYYVLYGSKDGDISGNGIKPRGTGFALWDRANNNTEKTMSFVYGATHNGFITDNHDYPDPTVTLESIPVQKKITAAYMNAFFRTHLKNEIVWQPVFKGNYIPLSVPKKDIYQQYKAMNVANTYKIIDFEGSGPFIGISPGQVSLRKAVTASSSVIADDELYLLDSYSFQNTNGINVMWNAGDKLIFHISAAGLDISGYKYISFRITQVANLITPYTNVDGLKVSLIDDRAAGPYPEVNITKKIPEPDRRIDTGPAEQAIALAALGIPWTDEEVFTKSALMTVRLLLEDFSNAGVNLVKIKELHLVFPAAAGTGKIDLDDVQFTKL